MEAEEGMTALEDEQDEETSFLSVGVTRRERRN
jgi:hypothetical protein